MIIESDGTSQATVVEGNQDGTLNIDEQSMSMEIEMTSQMSQGDQTPSATRSEN